MMHTNIWQADDETLPGSLLRAIKTLPVMWQQQGALQVTYAGM
jgi:hypothetical protein